MFKITTVDKSEVTYHLKLSKLTLIVYKIGLNYNQAVKVINRHSKLPQQKNAMARPCHTKKLIELMKKTISQSQDFHRESENK